MATPAQTKTPVKTTFNDWCFYSSFVHVTDPIINGTVPGHARLAWNTGRDDDNLGSHQGGLQLVSAHKPGRDGLGTMQPTLDVAAATEQ
jgi:hypothetical protein